MHKTAARAIDGPDVMTDEGEWEKSSTFIKPSILKAKLEDAKKIIHDIELVNDRKRKQEWSEEDYNEIETIACHLDNIDNEGMAEVLRNIRDKYYHTIPQSTWKPSKEQMKQLKSAANICPDSRLEHALRNLYQDLKKLREE